MPPRWLGAALAAGALLLWGIGLLVQVSTKAYASQDDASQHIVWFRADLPTGAMPVSEIADYFLSSNGALFIALYRGLARAGIDPIHAAWGVGLGAALIAAFAAGRTVAALGRGDPHAPPSGVAVAPSGVAAAPSGVAAAPWAAAAAPALMLLYLAGSDDVHSGTARAIGWALLGLALWMLARGRALGFALLLSVGAFCYPTVVVLALTAAALAEGWALIRHRDWRRAARWLPAGIVPALLLLLAMAGPDGWGPTVTLAEARTLPDFAPGGRTPLFGGGWAETWLGSARLGLLPGKVQTLALTHVLAIAALLLGLVPRHGRALLLALAGASVLLWLAANITLFALYLPARFPTFGFGFASVLAAAWLAGDWLRRSLWWRVAALFIALPGSIYLISGDWPDGELKPVRSPALVAPLIAAGPGRLTGLSTDIDRMPIVARRDVHWGNEFSQAYKNRYRRMMRGRSVDLVDALVADRPAAVAAFLRANRIAAVMLPDDLWQPAGQSWARALYPAERARLARADAAGQSWLWRQAQCLTQGEQDRLYDAACLIRAAGE